MATINHWIKRLTGVAAEDTAVKGIGWLFFPSAHVHMLSTRRAELILSRTRILAAMFALLTCLWIAVDFAFLPPEVAHRLAWGRAAAAAVFVVLALSFRGSNRMQHAYCALAVLFAIPTLFYIYSFAVLNGAAGNSFAAATLNVYAVLPVVVLAGISVFPLTALEALAFALPVLVIVPAASKLDIALLNIGGGLGAFWLLAMVTLVASISGISQLGFMISLMGQAMRDPLTKCFSRLSIEELLDLQFILSSRNQTPLTLAFIDLDHFKSINDGYGHEAGDHVLNSAAAQMRGLLRNGDMLGRWGGEEFILVLPNTTIDQALLAIQRMQQHGFGLRPDGTPITASIGLAERVNDFARDWHMLVEIADKRMYRAKESGRNRIADHRQIIENTAVQA